MNKTITIDIKLKTEKITNYDLAKEQLEAIDSPVEVSAYINWLNRHLTETEIEKYNSGDLEWLCEHSAMYYGLWNFQFWKI